LYLEIPPVTTATPAERLQALNDAKALMSGNESSGSFGSLFATKSAPGAGATAIDGFIRLAEYITTGHDYKDTHPEGKRRPIIRNITNVTVMAPSGIVPDQEDIEHLLHHVENGDFAEFVRDMMNGQPEPETGDAEKSADSHLSDEERKAGLDGK
jgi:hypothetical protein